MTIAVTHKFLSAKADSPDSTRVQPSNWNDTHDISMAANAVVGRGAGVGQAAAEELPLGVTGKALLATATADEARATIAAAPDTVVVSLSTVSAVLAAALSKVTPVDADSVTIIDSAASNVAKRVTFANFWLWIKGKADALYASTAVHTTAVWQAGADVTETIVSPLKVKAAAIAAGGGAPDVVMEDRKATGTDGGTFLSGAWRTRDLNTVVRDPAGIMTLVGSQFTPSVNGWLEWECPAFRVATHKSRLYNVTDSVEVDVGTPEKAAAGTDVPSASRGRAALTAGKQYRLEHQSSQNQSNNGFGAAVGFGSVEIYSRATFHRLA